MLRLFLLAALLPAFSLGGAVAPDGGAAGPDLQASPRPFAIQPGQWEIVIEMDTVEAPGAPEAFLQSMRGTLASQRNAQSQCITPEQARDPTRNMMGSENPARCDLREAIWAGGEIRVRGTCGPADGLAVQMSVDGRYDARRFDARLSLDMALPGEAGSTQPVRLAGRLTGRRTGNCRSG